MNCPKCNHPNINTARFCMECGYEFPEQPAEPAIQAKMPDLAGIIKEDTPSQPIMTPSVENNDIETAAMDRIKALFGQTSSNMENNEPKDMSTTTEKIEVTQFDSPDAESEMLPVEISYAKNRLFHEGGNFILETRVRSKETSLMEVHTWLNITIAEKTYLLSLKSKKEDEYGFHCYTNFYLPGKKDDVPLSGQALVNGYVLCILPRGIQYYEFDVRHAIIPVGQTQNTIINNYTLDGGSLLKVTGSIINNTASGDDIIKDINRQAPLFKGIKISKTEWRPEDLWMANENIYEHPGKYDELTLEYGGLLIHVLAKDDISIGRFKDNDIALVDWVNNRAYDQSPSVSVSRHHAIFHHDGNDVVLENLSSDGTGIEGGRKTILKGQTTSLSASAATLDFGFIRLYACAQTCRQKKLKDMCANCMGHPVKSLVLTRADNLPEIFVCVWQCCELEAISPDLKGFTLYRRNGGFMLQTPSEKVYNLELDLELEEDGREIKVIHEKETLNPIRMGFDL